MVRDVEKKHRGIFTKMINYGVSCSVSRVHMSTLGERCPLTTGHDTGPPYFPVNDSPQINRNQSSQSAPLPPLLINILMSTFARTRQWYRTPIFGTRVYHSETTLAYVVACACIDTFEYERWKMAKGFFEIQSLLF